MSANLKFKPSGSADVASYTLYHKPYVANETLTKDNATDSVDLGKPNAQADGFIHIELATIPELQSLDGEYDLGVAAIDDAGNVSPLLTQGLANISLDFLAPSPPSEASVYWN
jgi:hypothetical protein